MEKKHQNVLILDESQVSKANITELVKKLSIDLIIMNTANDHIEEITKRVIENGLFPLLSHYHSKSNLFDQLKLCENILTLAGISNSEIKEAISSFDTKEIDLPC